MKKPPLRTHRKCKHFWITEDQENTLKELKVKLGLNTGEIFRKVIDKDYVYINIYNQIKYEFKKQGINLNQAMYLANTLKDFPQSSIDTFEEIKIQQKEILEQLRRIK